MTDNQKVIIETLLNRDHYLLETNNYNGVSMYKLYKGNQIPVRYVHAKTVSSLRRLFKRSKTGRLTLNLNLVRQEHGNSFIKQHYKKATRHGNGSNKS